MLQVVSLHFVGWYNNKGLVISVWMYPILGEPCYIGVSLVMCLIFASCLLLFLCDLFFLTIAIIAKRSIWMVNSQEIRVPNLSGSNGRRRKF